VRSDLTVARVRGIPIGVSWSWLLIFALITWALYTAFYPVAAPGLASGTYLAMALATAALFFGSVLVHELGHALVGVREGVQIEGITLWLLGGVATFKGRAPTPGASFRMTAVGPAISLGLAVAFWALWAVGDRVGLDVAVLQVLGYLARINGILAAFNLVPALPLDGGRILHAWLWRRLGSAEEATVQAARVGRAFGTVLIALGVLGFVTGAGLGGLWLVFIGWFLAQAAGGEAAAAIAQRALGGRRVRDLMTADPATMAPSTTVDRFLDEASRAGGHSTYPVVDDGRLVGLVSVRMAGSVPPAERARTTVAQVMAPAEAVPTLRPDDDLARVMEQDAEPAGRFVVVDDGRVVGIVSRSDLARLVEVASLQPAPVAVPARRVGVGVWVAVAAVLVLAAGVLYRPPLAVVSPAPPIDITRDVTIRGVETTPIRGRYLAVPVSVEQRNALVTFLAFLDPDRDVVPLSAIVPPGPDPGRAARELEAQFRESQLVAAAAAARAAGYEVGVDGTGARVVQLLPGSPADRALEPGDVIVAVDGQAVRLATDLRRLFGQRPAGTMFRLDVERLGSRIEVMVRSARLQQGLESFTGIGVAAETRDLAVDLPFEVAFEDRSVGGPSAGLAYALLIADLLGPEDLAAGRTLAATGTVDLQGTVGPVGGLAGKLASARAAAVDLVLVPRQADGVAEADGVPVRPVATLQEALQALRAA
jgi:PDZ domain-containing secreted protein/Zn-dependent protease/predicted transcriptional regulator